MRGMWGACEGHVGGGDVGGRGGHGGGMWGACGGHVSGHVGGMWRACGGVFAWRNIFLVHLVLV